jgi:hypothetical protein
MPKLVVTGAQTQCTMGMAPSKLIAIPKGPPVQGNYVPAATILDNMPNANVIPFGMCQSIVNPVVASATAAASGVLTPMPCVPATPAPWVPGAIKTLIYGTPALHQGCKLNCLWAGVISITDPGQTTIDVA